MKMRFCLITALWCGVSLASLPNIIPQGMQAPRPVALPSAATIDRQKKIREFFKALKEDGTHTIKNCLQADPWLLTERDPVENKTPIYVIAEQYRLRYDPYDTYYAAYDDQGNRTRNWRGITQFAVFKHMLQLGQNDQTFIQDLPELADYLKTYESDFDELIDAVKYRFPHKKLFRAYRYGDPLPNNSPAPQAPVAAVAQGNAQLTDDEKARLILDMSDAIKIVDVPTAKLLLAAHPWLVNAEIDQGHLLYTLFADVWGYDDPSARKDERKKIFALFLLKGANPDAHYKRSGQLTIRDYLRYSATTHPEAYAIFQEFNKNPQQLLTRFPELDDRPRAAIVPPVVQVPGQPAPAGARPNVAQQQQPQPPRPAVRPPSLSFWTKHKPLIIVAGALAGAAAIYYLKYRKEKAEQQRLEEELANIK